MLTTTRCTAQASCAPLAVPHLPRQRRRPLRVAAVAPGASPGELKGAKKLASKRPHAGGSSDLIYKLRAEKLQAYTERWKPDTEMGSRWNVMNALVLVAFVAPLLGLAFAAATYGSLWGVHSVTAL